MHVTSSELRVIRRGPLLLHLGLLGGIGCVMAEIPEEGTRGSFLEEPCAEAHWGMVLRGAVELRRDGDRLTLRAGTVFHVPDGAPAHTFHADGPAVIVSFGPALVGERTVEATLVEPDPAPAPTSAPERADAAGPGLAAGPPPAPAPAPFEPPEGPITVAGAARSIPIAEGRIATQAAAMGSWVFCEARFGATSGYASGWCDLPHWGMVLRGSLAIEWEHDVETLLAGDVFYCPPGPPGHRYEAADGATLIDFTPVDALAAGGRAIAWRPTLADLGDASGKRGRRPVTC